MKNLQPFLFAILAGICIGIGGCAFLAIDNKIVGALFFTVGLFTICTRSYYLFTGKVCYLFDNKPRYLLTLFITWVGNILGAWLVAYLISFTRLSDSFFAKAVNMCDIKMNDSLLSVFILGIFCNLLIFIAVDGYKFNSHHVGKYIGLFLGVAGFILCGFEHCVADMFYFASAGVLFTVKGLLYIVVISLGNAVGGLLCPVCEKIFK